MANSPTRPYANMQIFSKGAHTARSSAVILVAYALAAVARFLFLPGKLEPQLLLISIPLAVSLAILTSIDLATFRLPDTLTLPLIGSGVCLSAVIPEPHIFERVAAAAIAYAMLSGIASLYKKLRGKAGLGLGDAKLFAANGSWLGLVALPHVLLIASLGALLTIGFRALREGAPDMNQPIAFGPFLAFGFWVVWIMSL